MTGEYLAGLAFWAVTLGSVCGASILILRRPLRELRGAARAAAYVVVGTTVLIGVHLAPGLLGVMTRGTVLASAALALAGASLLTSRWRGGPRTARVADAPNGPESSPSIAMAIAASAAAVIFVVAQTLRTLDHPLVSSDALDFHLPAVAGWIQSGSYWQVGQFVPDLASGNYPNNGNVVLLSGILPWRDEALVRPTLLLYLLLTGVALYAIGIELRAPRSTSALAAAVGLCIPALDFDALVGNVPDVVMTATFAAGVLFLLRHARTRARSDLVLAGLGLGCAFGTKWFGSSSVVALAVVWGAAWLLFRRPLRSLARDAAVLAGLVAVAGGIWLIRNAVISGSPIFPAGIRLPGLTIFAAPPDPIRDRVGFRIADYLSDGDAWRHQILPAWRHALGLTGVVAASGVLLTALLARARRGRALFMAVGAVVLGAVYLWTPYSAFGTKGHPDLTVVNVRYAEPAMLMALPVAAWVAPRLGRWRIAFELLAVAAVVDGLRRGIGLSWSSLDGSALGATTIVAVAAAVATLGARRRLPHGLRAGAALVAATAIAAGAAVAWSARDSTGDYRRSEPVVGWIQANAPSAHRVGLAGRWADTRVSPVFGAFGPHFGNHVAFVGPHVDGMLREHRTRTAFVNALRRGRYDLLVVGLTPGPFPNRPPGHALVGWARAAGYRPVAADGRLELLRAPSAAFSP